MRSLLLIALTAVVCFACKRTVPAPPAPVPAKPAGQAAAPGDSPARSGATPPAGTGAAPAERDVSVETCVAADEYSKEHGGVAMLVIRNGETLFESFHGRFDEERPHPIGVGTRGLWGPLAMIGAQNELLHPDDPIGQVLEAWRDDPRGAITIRQLLDGTSGLQPDLPADPTGTLRDGERAMQAAPVAEPGRRWADGSTGFTLFGEVFGKLTAHPETRVAAPLFWVHELLLEPIAVKVEIWEKDAEGWPLFHTGVHLTVRQWGMFGELLRTGGRLPDESSLIDANVLGHCFEGTDANPAYGLGWHLGGATGPYADLPGARISGGDGQFLIVMPARELTIVRFGAEGQSDEFELTEMMSRLLATR